MATISAIADVGEALVEMLRDRIDFLEGNDIALTSPASIGDGEQLRLTLYLYRIAENADLKNNDHLVAEALFVDRSSASAHLFASAPYILHNC